MQCWYSDRKFPYREKSPKVPQCAFGTSLPIPNALPSWSYQYSPYFGLFAPLRGQNHYLGPKQPSCQSQYCIFWYGWKTIQKWKMVKTKVNSIIFEGCWIYKSGLRIFVWALKVPCFCTQNMQNCPPSAKRAIWGQISNFGPWEVQKVQTVVQRVKKAHWGTFGLFSL